jgi:hypothetical protein
LLDSNLLVKPLYLPVPQRIESRHRRTLSESSLSPHTVSSPII